MSELANSFKKVSIIHDIVKKDRHEDLNKIIRKATQNDLLSLVGAACEAGAAKCLSSVFARLRKIAHKAHTAQSMETNTACRISPFAIAARHDHDQLLPVLFNEFNSGGCSSLFENTEYQPLHVAAASNSVKCVGMLIDLFNRNVNEQTSTGECALHFAASNKCAEVLGLLLKYGGDVDLRDAEGASALYYACESDAGECCRKLLSFKPNLFRKMQLRAVTIQNFTPLHGAVASNSLSCLQILVEYDGMRMGIGKGEELQIPTSLFSLTRSGDSVFHLCCKRVSEEGEGDKKAKMLEYLFKCLEIGKLTSVGKTINLANKKNGLRCVDIAAKYNNVKCLQVLIRAGADLGRVLRSSTSDKTWSKKPTDDDHSPLFLASVRNSIDCLSLLLAKGDNPNINHSYVGPICGTALSAAFNNGRIEASRLLLRSGALLKREEVHPITAIIAKSITNLRDDIFLGWRRIGKKEARGAVEEVYCRNGRRVVKFLLNYRIMHPPGEKGEIRNWLAKLNDDCLGEILSFTNRAWFVV